MGPKMSNILDEASHYLPVIITSSQQSEEYCQDC